MAPTRSRCSTLTDLMSVGNDVDPALAAPDCKPLTFETLRSLVTRTIEALNQFGIGRQDRVAIVLPNGPEMAAAFIAVASGATAAPLNPSYKAEEFEFYMSDLKAKALVVEEGSTSAAIAVAKRL